MKYIKRIDESVNEGLILNTVRKSIGKIQGELKKKWKKTGGYENFGQDEISDLKGDSRFYNPYGTPEQRKAAKLIDALDQWAMNYTGESVEFIDENKFDIALNKMDEWLPEDPEAMERYMEILNQEGPKDMEKFFIEYGDEDRLQSYGLKSRDMKKLAKMAFESKSVYEATDVNDPVLVAFRATRRDLPKFTPAKAKSRRLSFDKYMDLLDKQTDIDQEIKDMAEEMAQTFRDMEQEAEPEGGEISDRYGTIMMKQEKEYAKLKAKKAKIDARIEKHRMS
jgi:hypothetical protein